MSIAKSKKTKETVVPFPDRVKTFETELIELIKKHQVGIRPELASDRTKIMAVLNYIDLVEITKANAEAAEKAVSREVARETGK